VRWLGLDLGASQPMKAGPSGANDSGACGLFHLVGGVVYVLSHVRPMKLFGENPRSSSPDKTMSASHRSFLLRVLSEVGMVGDDLWCISYEDARGRSRNMAAGSHLFCGVSTGLTVGCFGLEVRAATARPTRR
jgi:hypothetical protein